MTTDTVTAFDADRRQVSAEEIELPDAPLVALVDRVAAVSRSSRPPHPQPPRRTLTVYADLRCRLAGSRRTALELDDAQCWTTTTPAGRVHADAATTAQLLVDSRSAS
ncbi:hypothetical protein O2W14_06455 [Modestobacter sp. VKM Ac-2986]|uniref:hypothetical protein n=1 Tax=Modestobacter sp. VKM Ac-2986 TaxID=3004140 RepID=UPI0022AAFDCB|nr:hypothetical protein [Modestobacter sp. VKM Ac-2986]MCZ2828472.1 hypothetical protein [Modestobacter sp. VKM Ac-2986]